MKRITVALLALASFVLVGSAFALDPPTFQVLKMRNTAASTVARDPNWATNAGQSPGGFVDSVVFRRIGTQTSYDTSDVFFATNWTLPPTINFNPAALGDTLVPWLFLRVEQDSIRSANDPLLFTGTSGLDSIRFAIQHSPDGGRTWFSCSGTPTFRFDTIFFTSGQDGLQDPSLIGVEGSPGEDSATVPLKASYPKIPGAYIVNQNVPYIGEPLRIIVGGDSNGQFKLEVGGWPNRDPAQY